MEEENTFLSETTSNASTHELELDANDQLGWPWDTWCRTSPEALRESEAAILSCLGHEYTTRYISVGPLVGDQDVKVWTWSANTELEGIPMVLIHGMGSALALWLLNLHTLVRARDRPIYAIDLPGFGRSSRPAFSTDPKEVEEQFLKIIEAWRIKMDIEKMILVGHSFGGFLSYSYGIKYPTRVGHLVMADPWGFNKKPASLTDIRHIPMHHRVIVKVMDRLQLNPLWSVRFLGPFAPSLIGKVRADLISNFVEAIEQAPEKISSYIFHCNAQNPTGESAFQTMMSTFGWAKNPMHLRIRKLNSKIPLTLIYGSKSWVDHFPAEEIAKIRNGSYVDFHILDSGHHIYADKASVFNDILLSACSTLADELEECDLEELSLSETAEADGDAAADADADAQELNELEMYASRHDHDSNSNATKPELAGSGSELEPVSAVSASDSPQETSRTLSIVSLAEEPEEIQVEEQEQEQEDLSR